MPVGKRPSNATVSSLEKKGDCRKLFKSSGNYALTVSHKLDTKNTSVKLPSGSK